MMKVAEVSQKGGAGKSTLALHLAVEGATRGRKDLDLDPQGNLVGWAERHGHALPPDGEAIHASKLLVQIVEAEAERYNLLVLNTAPSADRASVLAAEVGGRPDPDTLPPSAIRSRRNQSDPRNRPRYQAAAYGRAERGTVTFTQRAA